MVTVHGNSDNADLDRNLTFQYHASPKHPNLRDAPSQVLPYQLMLCQLVPDQLLLCQLLPSHTVSPCLSAAGQLLSGQMLLSKLLTCSLEVSMP